VRRSGGLHDFDRSSDEIEEGWRDKVDPDEVAAMEELVAPIWAELEDRQTPLPRSVSA
jgi:hypothetical protein